jgi:hypothetical protein
MIKFARGRAVVVAGAACVLVTAAVVLTAGVQAEAGTASGWHVDQVYGKGQANINAVWPEGLAAPSAHSAWSIFGGCIWPCSKAATTFVAHWNGQRWRTVRGTSLDGLQADFVTASSASDAWLFGYFQNSTTIGAMHWNGTKWAERAVPKWLVYINGSGELGVETADISPSNLWVFSLGSYLGQKSVYASHYVGGRWKKVTLPAEPGAVAAVSGHDIWAFGQALGGGPLLLMHWNGHRWSTSRFPRQKLAGGAQGLISNGAKSLWTLWVPTKAGAAEYLLHWNGKRWSKVAALPSGDTSLAYTGDGHGGFWVDAVGPTPAQKQLFLHWSAGRWKVQDVPSTPGLQLGQVDEMALIPGTHSVWGTGHLYGKGNDSGLNRGAVWRYNP